MSISNVDDRKLHSNARTNYVVLSQYIEIYLPADGCARTTSPFTFRELPGNASLAFDTCLLKVGLASFLA
ncbi:hypothetical protein H6F73_21300 [Microcoleus sp. FACHB-68]|nr:hypothetical protein [Microcoleus sp. FACHB-68]